MLGGPHTVGVPLNSISPDVASGAVGLLPLAMQEESRFRGASGPTWVPVTSV